MGHKINYKKEFLRVLTELNASYPSYNNGRHFSMAFSEYGDVWDMSDKEMVFALQKYQAELQLDGNNIADEDFVEKIVKDGLNLGKEEEEYDEWDE